ncbi:DUF397 domain-containing protein [Nocardiopsis sp. NRRL B-16309]|uniref:DUF397 domain-containing protein n=1 Tax=Nocardiopsis sp. NRRL B-16309 TaxID=1519494 RepID=UPI0009EC1FC0|nr:DUF397 domain-containing protein [Nocardiopsis sp. NRRL B-16309]
MWHKSSYSPSGGDCVEVAEGATTLVRDTKHRDLGHLEFDPVEWAALVRATEVQ